MPCLPLRRVGPWAAWLCCPSPLRGAVRECGAGPSHWRTAPPPLGWERFSVPIRALGAAASPVSQPRNLPLPCGTFLLMQTCRSEMMGSELMDVFYSILKTEFKWVRINSGTHTHNALLSGYKKNEEELCDLEWFPGETGEESEEQKGTQGTLPLVLKEGKRKCICICTNLSKGHTTGTPKNNERGAYKGWVGGIGWKGCKGSHFSLAFWVVLAFLTCFLEAC